MGIIYVKKHENLSRQICFKPVMEWIKDAAREFGYDEVRVVPDLTELITEPDLALDEPMIFSPLLEKGNSPLPWGRLLAGTLEDLQETRAVIHEAIIEHHTRNGVDIVDAWSTYIGPDVTIGKGTTILPNVVIRGRVSIGEGCELGPFAHIRPDVDMGPGVRLGAFVEVKNSILGQGSHASHLTYIGDADVGDRVSFGCGSVTVNYNGAEKYRTTIQNDAFIGCNTNLVAPVTIHDSAFTAAGSTVTEDVPPESLAIARGRQVNKTEWKRPKKKL